MNGEHKTGMYKRMAMGGLIGAVVSGALGYLWAVYKNNINPVAGVGIATLCCMGLIVGAVLGILPKRRK